MQLDEWMATCAIVKHTHKSLLPAFYYKSIFYGHHRQNPAEDAAVQNRDFSFAEFPFSFDLFLLGLFTQRCGAMS